jgi:hypothetical protein
MGDAAQEAGGAAAGAACTAEVGPEAAPFCAYAGSRIAGALESGLGDLVGDVGDTWKGAFGGGCSGVWCTVPAPEDVLAGIVKQKGQPAADAALAAWGAYQASEQGQTEIAFRATATFGNPDLQVDIPAGTVRRWIESTYLATFAATIPPGWHVKIKSGWAAEPGAKIHTTPLPMSTGKKVAVGAAAVGAVGLAGWGLWMVLR